MIAVIQTNIPERIALWLVDGRGKVHQSIKRVPRHATSKTLELFDTFLRQYKQKPSTVDGIVVVRGPGAFTAVRIGLLLGNTVATTYTIPIRGVVQAELLTAEQVQAEAAALKKSSTARAIKPWYGKEPNISVARQRA